MSYVLYNPQQHLFLSGWNSYAVTAAFGDIDDAMTFDTEEHAISVRSGIRRPDLEVQVKLVTTRIVRKP